MYLRSISRPSSTASLLLSPPAVRGVPRGLSIGLTILLASLVIGLSAQLSLALPIGPVPVTGQTLGVLLIAAALGPKLGVASVLAYLAQGAIGLPVFASGTAGWTVVAGPTGGYLAGFLLAALIIGALAERGWTRHPLSMSLAMLLGTIAIYALGVARLSEFVGWEQVWGIGVQPFLAGDAIKIALAAGLLPGAWKIRDLLLPQIPR